MRTISTPITTTYEVQKSKFICFLFSVTNKDMINDHLLEIKSKYPDATHHCYAYIINTEKRCSDDGEPTGTAGMPILNVLEKQNLNFVLCIVVRYFGGILLGAGGLVRAYTTSVTTALSKCSYANMIAGKELKLTFPYSNQKYVDSLLKHATIMESNYQEQIQYYISIPDVVWDDISTQLFSYLTNFQIIKDCYCMIQEN